MTISTKNVTGRRQVHYDNYQDLLNDAERLANQEVITLGNWSLGQILKHLAIACHGMIDGLPVGLPAPAQWLMRLTMKRRFLTKTLPPGFKLPAKASSLVPDPTTPEEGLSLLREAIARLATEPERAPNGAFGKLSREEWDAFQLRHAEMHMSFVVPAESGQPGESSNA